MASRRNNKMRICDRISPLRSGFLDAPKITESRWVMEWRRNRRKDRGRGPSRGGPRLRASGAGSQSRIQTTAMMSTHSWSRGKLGSRRLRWILSDRGPRWSREEGGTQRNQRDKGTRTTFISVNEIKI